MLRRFLSKAQRLFVVGLLQGFEELGAEDRAQGPHREEEARLGGHPAGAVLGQRASGHQAVEMEVGIERLVPGVQHHRRAELTTQVLLAKLEERLAGSAEEQGQEETGVAHDERIESVRPGKHRVEVGRGKQLCAPRFHPLGLGPRLTCGTVAIPARAIRIARKATLRTPLRMPPQLCRAAGHDGVNALLLGR